MTTDPRGRSKLCRSQVSNMPPLPYSAPVYAPTAGRAPMHSLARLPIRATETTGQISGHGPIGGSDHDLIHQHAGTPIGERIVVSARLLDNNGRPTRPQLRRHRTLPHRHRRSVPIPTIMPGSHPWEDRCDA
jgi:hypothetical protein